MSLPLLRKLLSCSVVLGLLISCGPEPAAVPQPIEKDGASPGQKGASNNRGKSAPEDDKKKNIKADPSIQAQVQVINRSAKTNAAGVHHVEGTSGSGVKWVMINEVSLWVTKADSFANPFASPWVELYSREAETFDLAGYRIGTDPSKGFEGALPLPANSFIEFEGYLAVFDNNKDQGRPVLNLGMTVPGEVQLWDPQGNLVDHIRWDARYMPENGSLSRVPDGAPGFNVLQDSIPMRRIRPYSHDEKVNFSAFGRRAK